MKVLIIPEDPTHDRHVLKPLVKAMMRSIGRRARVEVLSDPHLRGVAQALDRDTIRSIIQDNRMIDIFLLLVDRDCDRTGSEAKAAALEDDFDNLLACLAQQEVEVWAIALHRDDLPDAWGDVRGHCDPKEEYFDPLVTSKGLSTAVGQGRKALMRELPGNWNSLKGRCPEIQQLEEKVEAFLASHRED